MKDPVYLSLDQGGQSSRALVFDGTGRVLASAQVPVETRRPRDGFVESNANALAHSLREAAQTALAPIGNPAVARVGLATQRSTLVAWNRRTGEDLSSAISWQDTRGAELVESITPNRERVQALSGLPLSAHFGASKLRWLWDHAEPVRAAHRKGELAWGPLAGYLAFQLTEEHPHQIDPANATRTQLWNPDRRDWSPELLELFGLPADPLPESRNTRDDHGHMPLPGGAAPLSVITGDQSAVPFIHGWPSEGAVFINLGTGAFLQRVAHESSAPEGLSWSIVYRDDEREAMAVEASVNGAGSALEWIAPALGADLETALADLPSTTEALFLNGVSGLASPYWRPRFESRFIGEPASDGERVLAVLESIAFLIRVNLDRLPPVDRLVATGGLARSDRFLELLATVTELPVERPALVEATATGVGALLAMDQGTWAGPPVERSWEPGPSHPRFERWQSLLEGEL